MAAAKSNERLARKTIKVKRTTIMWENTPKFVSKKCWNFGGMMGKARIFQMDVV
jgi:hypothetical protein